MEVLFVLFAVALVWLYFWAKRLDAQEKKRQQRVLNLYEDQKKVDEFEKWLEEESKKEPLPEGVR